MKATYDATGFGKFGEKKKADSEIMSTFAVLKTMPSSVAARSGMAGRPAASRARCRPLSVNWRWRLRQAYSGWPVCVSASAKGEFAASRRRFANLSEGFRYDASRRPTLDAKA